MKTCLTLSAALLLTTLLHSQLPFAPLGAVWVATFECDPGGPPPVTLYQTVDKDSIIDGKYCTRLLASDWPCWQGTYPYIFVHDDNGKVYRWDHEQSAFHLVLDYTKEADESWRIPVCEEIFGSDSVTITVNQKDGIYRNVSVVADAGGHNDLYDLDLYEGFGGTIGNPLLLYPIIIADPACWTNLDCYADPVNGQLFGNAPCTTATKEENGLPFLWTVSPNPSTGAITAAFTTDKAAVVQLSVLDGLGRLLQIFEEEKLPPGQHQLRHQLDQPAGVYWLRLQVDGAVGVKKLLVW